MWHESATQAMSVLVLGRRVSLVPGATEDSDRYGGLRYVDVGSRDAGLSLISDGWAIARYDSRDGYGRHPRDYEYVSADVASEDRGCATPMMSPDPGGSLDGRDWEIAVTDATFDLASRGTGRVARGPDLRQGVAGAFTRTATRSEGEPAPRLLDARTGRYFVDPSARPTPMCAASRLVEFHVDRAADGWRPDRRRPRPGAPRPAPARRRRSPVLPTRWSLTRRSGYGLRIAREGDGGRAGSRQSSSNSPVGLSPGPVDRNDGDVVRAAIGQAGDHGLDGIGGGVDGRHRSARVDPHADPIGGDRRALLGQGGRPAHGHLPIAADH